MSGKIYKIAVVGDGGTGKTTLIKAKCENIFDECSQMTIGIDFAVIPFKKKEDDSESDESIEDLDKALEESLEPIEEQEEDNSVFGVFDFGGQKRFHFIHDAYLKGVKIAVILYDLTRFQTFDNIRLWHALLQEENPTIPILLVGTKSDLVDEDTKLSYTNYWNDIKNDFPNHEFIYEHFFVSAKNQAELNQLFIRLEEISKELVQ